MLFIIVIKQNTKLQQCMVKRCARENIDVNTGGTRKGGRKIRLLQFTKAIKMWCVVQDCVIAANA